jgi:hypothetical protein
MFYQVTLASVILPPKTNGIVLHRAFFQRAFSLEKTDVITGFEFRDTLIRECRVLVRKDGANGRSLR